MLFPTDPLPETNRKRDGGYPFTVANSQFTVLVYGRGLRESRAITGADSRERPAFCRTIPNCRPLGRPYSIRRFVSPLVESPQNF